MRQLSGVADDAEHLLGLVIEDGQPVPELAAGEGHAVVAAPAKLPGSCGAFFGAHAHGIDQAAAEPGMGFEIAAQFVLVPATFERGCAPPY